METPPSSSTEKKIKTDLFDIWEYGVNDDRPSPWIIRTAQTELAELEKQPATPARLELMEALRQDRPLESLIPLYRAARFPYRHRPEPERDINYFHRLVDRDDGDDCGDESSRFERAMAVIRAKLDMLAEEVNGSNVQASIEKVNDQTSTVSDPIVKASIEKVKEALGHDDSKMKEAARETAALLRQKGRADLAERYFDRFAEHVREITDFFDLEPLRVRFEKAKTAIEFVRDTLMPRLRAEIPAVGEVKLDWHWTMAEAPEWREAAEVEEAATLHFGLVECSCKQFDREKYDIYSLYYLSFWPLKRIIYWDGYGLPFLALDDPELVSKIRQQLEEIDLTDVMRQEYHWGSENEEAEYRVRWPRKRIEWAPEILYRRYVRALSLMQEFETQVLPRLRKELPELQWEERLEKSWRERFLVATRQCPEITSFLYYSPMDHRLGWDDSRERMRVKDPDLVRKIKAFYTD